MLFDKGVINMNIHGHIKIGLFDCIYKNSILSSMRIDYLAVS